MNSAYRQIAIILVASIALAFLYFKTQDNHAQQYNRSMELLSQIKQIDATFNQDILKVRYNLLLHYDTLKNGRTAMLSLLHEIQKNKIGSHDNGDEYNDQHIKALETLINNKLDLVETFKSRNAVLKNSSRYLPSAIETMIRRMIKRNISTTLVNQIHGLLSNTLSYSITGDETFKHQVTHIIEIINSSRVHYPDEFQPALSHLLLHTQIILAENPAVDELIPQITNTNITQQLDNLANNYSYYHTININEKRIYQRYLYVFTLALLGYIGYIVLRLRNSAITLKRAVTDLNYQKFAMDQHSIVSISDVTGKILYVNDRLVDVSQYSRDELQGKNHNILGSGYHPPEFFKHMWQTISSGNVWNGQIKNRSKDNRYYWVDSTIVPFMDENNKPYQYISIRTDITEHKNLEEALFREKELALVTLQSIADGVITTDIDGNIEYINPQAEHLTGWNHAQAKGRDLLQICVIQNQSSATPVTHLVENCLKGENSSLESTVILTNRNGHNYNVEVAITPLLNRDGIAIGTVIVIHDVTAVRTLASQMSYQASHDALTGLINRREFERRLNLMIESAKTHNHEHALCYLDLDQFKLVNDTCGHIAGDELLRQLATVLSANIRDRDTLARLGGDEFGILLGECLPPQAKNIAEKICATVKDFRFVWGDKAFELGVSIGLVEITKQSENITNIMSAADTACYAAKDRGRNRVHVYQADDKELQARYGEMQWVPRLAQALTENRFRLYCQLIVPANGETQKGVHYEVLLRMMDEHGQMVPPGAFLPAAERYNLMPTIDRWVVRETFSIYQKYAAHNSNLQYDKCSINLSGASLNDDQFLPFLHEQIDRWKIPSEVLCFEITETVAIANLAKALYFIKELKKRGCHFALDDFGSGLSSFAYLKNLPVDYLKIDGNFIVDIVDDPIDFAMVRSINEIGHVMGISTIAEYVESEDIIAKIGEIGVDYLQGYAISKPTPFDAFMEQRSIIT